MQPFRVHTGIVAPLDRANVDTDAIIPKQFLKSIERSGFGVNLFDAWRYLDHGEPGMDASSRRPNPQFVLNEPRYRGAPSATRFSTAVAQHGEVQIELVEQHDDGPSAYRDTVPAGATGFHHVAFIAEDFAADLAHYTDQGFAVAADGLFGPMRYAYVDTSAPLGHMIEIVEDKPAIRAFFAAVRKAADRWDRDPATLLRELG